MAPAFFSCTHFLQTMHQDNFTGPLKSFFVARLLLIHLWIKEASQVRNFHRLSDHNFPYQIGTCIRNALRIANRLPKITYFSYYSFYAHTCTGVQGIWNLQLTTKWRNKPLKCMAKQVLITVQVPIMPAHYCMSHVSASQTFIMT